GYSSAVKAIVNICGAIGDTSWMEPGDEPLASAQGNDDNTVPYCTAMISVSGFPVMIVSGSGSMVKRANNLGIPNRIHTFYGQGHSSPAAPGNIDTTIVLTSDFFYTQMGCTPINTAIYTNVPLCLNTGIDEIILSDENVEISPNPSMSDVLLKLKNVKGNKFSIRLTDVTGRNLREFQVSGDRFQVERKNLQSGIYFLKLNSDAGETFTAKIIFIE
ncbi:MAG: T9SS type A sorting domain-containing protein, partial [Bacteroidetes bacterium]